MFESLVQRSTPAQLTASLGSSEDDSCWNAREVLQVSAAQQQAIVSSAHPSADSLHCGVVVRQEQEDTSAVLNVRCMCIHSNLLIATPSHLPIPRPPNSTETAHLPPPTHDTSPMCRYRRPVSPHPAPTMSHTNHKTLPQLSLTLLEP
jgi:hypothetical protein